jgi:hypothetical protein
MIDFFSYFSETQEILNKKYIPIFNVSSTNSTKSNLCINGP